jgi:hypothetical protein
MLSKISETLADYGDRQQKTPSGEERGKQAGEGGRTLDIHVGNSLKRHTEKRRKTNIHRGFIIFGYQLQGFARNRVFS